MRHHTERGPVIPPDHAFVVQLHIDTQIEAGRVTGRVEHLVSRQATSFQSLEALLKFMARVLREVRTPDPVHDDMT
jgi:hypothetical protein